MNMIKWVAMGGVAAILCGCAGSAASSGVQVSSQSATVYPAIPATSCRVSSHPPLGKYIVIAQLTATADIGETADHLLHRLQQQGASLGAEYVMVMTVSDKTYITPENSEVADNPYLSNEASFFNTASPAATGYNNVNGVGTAEAEQEVITAEALKITSGTNKPNKALPSNLWQVRTN